MNAILSLFFVVISALLFKIFCVLAQDTRLMDKPNERSLHVNPTLRGGGLIFIGLSLLSVLFLLYFSRTPSGNLYAFIISIILLATVSFLDDLYTISASSRLFVQCVTAGIIILFMRPIDLDFIIFSFTNQYLIGAFLFFAIIWAINHFNFMDGLDGFCASQAIFLLLGYALLFNSHNAQIYQDFCLILISSLIGFLIFNFPPASLFMGDIGSATLGLISFTLAVIAQQKFQIPIVYWCILNSLFLFDATLTLFRRIVHGEKWSVPHRKHAYQRLKQLGVGTWVILLGQMLLNVLFLIFVLLLHYKILELSLVLTIQLFLLCAIYLLIEKRFPMFKEVNA